MRLVIAEKPSVARDLARVLGATRRGEGFLEGPDLRISWCVGHLLELEEPAHYDPRWRAWSAETLPMLPEAFALRPRESGKDQLAVLKKLLADRQVREVVNACDAGREGELIFRWLLEYCGCRRPVLRFWASSLTEEAIQRAWRGLEPAGRYDRLADAARCRSEADWLVGLNATRALTCRARETGGDSLLSVGRVQTPTLAMIVARDEAIARFVPEPYWTVRGAFQRGGSEVVATWFREGGAAEPPRPEGAEAAEEAPPAERLPREAAEQLAAALRGRQGRVVKAERKNRVEKPPLLYDLTSLQRRANQRFGLSADRTLQIAQSLYERHKLITYPRTDSRFLTPDQVPGLADLVRGLAPLPPYAAACASLLAAPLRVGPRLVNPAEVGDHHAILPTGRTPDPSALEVDEKRVFDLVARRLLAALSPDALFELTLLVLEVEEPGPLPEAAPPPPRLRARGRVCRQVGWRQIDPPGGEKERDLPPWEVGDPASLAEVEVREGQTRPPPAYSDASVLAAMETAGKTLDDEELARALRSRGLGTPATRAAILQTLVERAFVERRGRELHATAKGKALIAAVPVEELKSAELTGRWEGRLQDILDGQDNRPAFLAAVRDHVTEVVRRILDASAPPVALEASRPKLAGPALGPCPNCQAPVRAGERGWACEQACGFRLGKTLASRELSTRMVTDLLRRGRSATVKGFKSKQGREFEAALTWSSEQKRVVFTFDEAQPTSSPTAPTAPAAPRRARPSTPPRAAPLRAAPLVVGDRCPRCGQGRLIRGRFQLGCDRYQAGCDFRAPLPEEGAG